MNRVLTLLVLVSVAFRLDARILPNARLNGSSLGDSNDDPDVHRTLEEMVHDRNFNLEEHYVTTEDGYILMVHRLMPFDHEPDYSKNRKPVIVFHGLLGGSQDFFFNAPDEDCVGYALVKTGRYDVWLPNARGNGASINHTKYTYDDEEFWQFTFDHMGRFDLPAVIGLVQKETGHHKLGYIGYSQGTTLLFAMLSTRPKFAEVIEPAISWGPPLYISHLTSNFGDFTIMEPILDAFGRRILSFGFISSTLSGFCEKALNKPDCFVKGMMGESEHSNLDRTDVVLSKSPNDASRWDMAHFAQLIRSDNFVRFDYPTEAMNLKEYGSVQAPPYPLENIPKNFTIAIMRGDSDAFVVEQDVQRLLVKLHELGLNVIDYPVPAHKFNHFDFIMGKGVGKLVYDKVVQVLDQYSKNN